MFKPIVQDFRITWATGSQHQLIIIKSVYSIILYPWQVPISFTQSCCIPVMTLSVYSIISHPWRVPISKYSYHLASLTCPYQFTLSSCIPNMSLSVYSIISHPWRVPISKYSYHLASLTCPYQFTLSSCIPDMSLQFTQSFCILACMSLSVYSINFHPYHIPISLLNHSASLICPYQFIQTFGIPDKSLSLLNHFPSLTCPCAPEYKNITRSSSIMVFRPRMVCKVLAWLF